MCRPQPQAASLNEHATTQQDSAALWKGPVQHGHVSEPADYSGGDVHTSLEFYLG